MARITDAINQGLERLSTSPLGMASLGLLMQPSMSKEPINPWAYAAKGLEMGMQNRQLAAQQKSEAELQAMRRNEYARRIMQFNQEQQALREAEAEKARQAQAMQELMSTMDPKEAQIAAVLGPKYVEQMLQQRMQTGRLPAANIQEYEEAKRGGFTGSIMDYLTFKNTRPVSPHYQAIPTEKGVQIFDTRAGRIVGTQGEPPAQYDPETQASLAAARSGGQVTGERVATAKLDLPGYLSSSQQMLGKVQNLINHPGMSAAVGAPSIGKAGIYIPGTEASNFMALLKEVQGGQFLEAFKSLRGGGAITQTEGEKATQAISSMSTAQSEEAFVKAANDFMDVVRAGIQRAQEAAGVTPTETPPSSEWQTLPNGVRVRRK